MNARMHTFLVFVLQDPNAAARNLAWLIVAPVTAVLLLSAVTLFVLHKLGGIRAMVLFRSKQIKSAPPDLGQQVTLVLTDIKGSTELWEWDTELAAQVSNSITC